MYKVKRFSQINPSVYQQRDYNWIGDLGRRYKGRIVRAVEESIDKNRSTINNSISKFHSQVPLNNSKIEKELLRKAKEYDSRTVGMTYDNTVSTGSKLNFNKRSMDLTDSEASEIGNRYDPSNRPISKLKNARKSSKNIIFHPNGSGVEQLAHEIGHIMNRDSKNPISQYVSNSDTSLYHKSDDMANKKGLLNVAKGYIKGKVKLHEESKATKKGLGLLKKLGANEDGMKMAKENLNNNLEAYKSEARLSYLYPLKNSLD